MAETMSKAAASQEVTKRKVLAELAKLGGGVVGDDDLIFKGKQIVLPETMDIDDGIKFLKRKREADEEETAMHRTYDFRPWDGAHATWVCMREFFGAAIGVRTPTMFGSEPPHMVTVPVSPTETVEVPWGRMVAPGLERGYFELGTTRDSEKGILFQLTYSGPRKHRPIVQGFFNAVETYLADNSIYLGKAVNGKSNPEFLDLTGVDASKVVYSQEVLDQLDASVWSLIEHTPEMRRRGLPLKRSVLFEGPYGTGKSLASMITAQKAVEHGWTFIQCRPGRDDLGEVMATAQLYQPAVVFFEDVDVVAQGESTDKDAVSELLDTFDGITSKGTEIMVVLTTNHVEKIHKGMMRPGRLDAVIRIDELDDAGIEKLVKVTIGGDLAEDIEWPLVTAAMEDFQPAFVKEASDRAIRYQIARGKDGKDGITTSDLVLAANGLRPQLELMTEAGEGKVKPDLTNAMESMVGAAVDTRLHGAKLDRGMDDDADSIGFIKTVGAGS